MYLLLSDVHGNMPALRAVLEDAAGEYDAVICAGDLVGYNPFPEEVIREVINLGARCIRGNHDRAVMRDDYTGFSGIAIASDVWTRKRLSQSMLSYLASLPDSLRLGDMEVHHGSPWDEDLYLYPEEWTGDIIPPGVRYLILGHTHVQAVRRFERGAVINPGSVGQPRDGDPRAAYALLDPETGEVLLKHVEYDVDEVAEAIIREGLPRYLAERLYMGV